MNKLFAAASVAFFASAAQAQDFTSESCIPRDEFIARAEAIGGEHIVSRLPPGTEGRTVEYFVWNDTVVLYVFEGDCIVGGTDVGPYVTSKPSRT